MSRSKEQLRQKFMGKAEAVFEQAIGRGEQEQLTLLQMEELIEGLKFELTSLLVESLIEVQAQKHQGPGPSCERCGGEMYSKGKKRRRLLTSQGQISLERRYHYCDRCGSGLFPPGPTPGLEPAAVE